MVPMPFDELGTSDPATSTPPEVRVDLEERADAAVLRVAGELDMLTTPRLEEAIRDALETGPARLVVDLTGVTFLASPALTALVVAHRSSGERTSLRVVPGGRANHRLLELTGLTDYLALYPTQEAALEP